MSRTRSTRSKGKFTETNGAVSTIDSKAVSGVTKGKAANTPPKDALRQTDGSYMPITGPVTNVHQLIKSKTVAKGSPGAFATLADYGKFLRNLTTADLHRHALEEMRTTPIDDSERLIRRLEAEWTNAAHRLAGDNQVQIPQRKAFSPEQLAKQNAIRQKMLGQS